MSDTSSKLKINIQQQGVVDLKSGISIGDTFEYQDSIYLAHKILTDGANQEMSYLKLFDSNNNLRRFASVKYFFYICINKKTKHYE